MNAFDAGVYRTRSDETIVWLLTELAVDAGSNVGERRQAAGQGATTGIGMNMVFVDGGALAAAVAAVCGQRMRAG